MPKVKMRSQEEVLESLKGAIKGQSRGRQALGMTAVIVEALFDIRDILNEHLSHIEKDMRTFQK